MKLDVMSRPAALVRLVALEPISYDLAFEACGWPHDEFDEVLVDCIARRELRFMLGSGGFRGGMFDLGTGVENAVRDFAKRARFQQSRPMSLARRLELAHAKLLRKAERRKPRA